MLGRAHGRAAGNPTRKTSRGLMGTGAGNCASKRARNKGQSELGQGLV